MLDIEKIKESALFIEQNIPSRPEIAIVLGSGLGGLVEEIQNKKEINYKDIPNFPVSTVQGHRGTLIFGTLNGIPVLVMSGRFHYYEGYSMQTLTFPIQVFSQLGIKKLILSNAAGGLNPSFDIADIMIITDHINLMANNPLLGPNNDQLGPRFPDMSEAYSHRMVKLAKKVAEQHNIKLQHGIYIGVTGPCYETPAEYHAFHILGADAVGMSTVPETIMARYLGMEVFALSVITDLGVLGQIEKASHEEVLNAAHKAEPNMIKLVKELVPQL
ncbi:MAG: purine-nucleoside phosphorylase [Bacteroidales bacterium]|jgi:purine-nucleoside phosphorylase|nr:purine-nucleoside phosphorylase [Bacteroidales bacterium]